MGRPLGRATILLVTLATLLGCRHGTDVAATDAGLPARVSVSPDAAGYCCEPIRVQNCGSPAFYAGGYGATPADCLGYWTDASWTPTTRELMDAHGCTYLDLATAQSCNARDAGNAGPDASADPS